MPRLILNQDKIVAVSASKTGAGVSVRALPKAPVELLRWDGSKLVDISKLEALWVDEQAELHAVQVPGSQLVQMWYEDRKRLIKSDGKWMIQDATEKAEQDRLRSVMAKRRASYPPIRDQLDAIMKYLATKPDLPEELQAIVNQCQDVKAKNPK